MRKKILIVLLTIVIIVVSLHVSLFIFINLKGKAFIIQNIEKEFGEVATLESLTLKFPFNLEIKNFKCGDVSFKEANIVLGFCGPFQFRLAFDKIDIKGLYVKVRKSKRGIKIKPFLIPELAQDKEESSAGQKAVPLDKPKVVVRKAVPLKIQRLHIEDGRIEFIDVGHKKPIRIFVQDISVKIKNIAFPELTKAHIDLLASLKSETAVSKDSVSLSGWVDYFRKDMDVNLNLTSIDYALFSQYYPQFWKPKALSIKQAYLSLKSHLHSENNDLTIKNTLTLDEIEYIDDGEESSRRNMAKTIVALIQGEKDKASLNFTVKTKMVPLVLDLSSIQKSFINSVPMSPGLVMQGVFGKTKRTVSGGVDSAKEVTADTMGKTIKAIKGLVGEFKDIFKSSEKASESKDTDPAP